MREISSGLNPLLVVVKTAWQPEVSWSAVQRGERITIEWPASAEIGMLRGEEGKRVLKILGVQAPAARRMCVQGMSSSSEEVELRR